VIDTPTFAESPAHCARNPLRVRQLFQTPDTLCTSVPLAQTEPRTTYAAFVARLQRQDPDVTFVDAWDVFCTAQACEVVDDAILLFRDRGHLTDYGSRLVAERIANRLSAGARAT
jgi:hypothetical protein